MANFPPLLICMLFVASALAGCHTQPMIALENPRSGETAECRSNPLFGDLDAQAQVCARAYESLGFVRRPGGSQQAPAR